MKYVIRHVPYGWKTTAIVVQKAKSHYLSEPVMRLGYITKYYGYKYVQLDLNLMGYCLYYGVGYESDVLTNRAMDMMINKWRHDSNILMKRSDFKEYYGKHKAHRQLRVVKNELDFGEEPIKPDYSKQPWMNNLE